jgi:hypothetical protein
MNRVDFGSLIANLRKEHEDEYNSPWSQDRLAQEANSALGAEVFYTDIISSIERGKRGLDKQTLHALATALQLTSGERKEFFLAASGLDNELIARQDNTPEEILSQLVERMSASHLPAFIMDSYCDVVATNGAMVELMDYGSSGLGAGIPQTDAPFARNMIRFAFSDDAVEHLTRVMGDDWSTFAYTVMMTFRTSTLRYRSTEYFQSLLREMNKYRMFKRYWREVYFEEKDHFISGADMYLSSPKWGSVSCFFAAFTALTTALDLHLWVAVPMSPETADAFSCIAAHADKMYAFNVDSSPQKNLSHS